MNEKEILSGVASALVEEPIYEFTVKVSEQMKLSKWRLVDWLLKLMKGVKEERERTFKIKPCKVANLHRVAGKAVTLPDTIGDGDLSDAVLPLMVPYRDTMVYITASAIQNNKREPSKCLIDFINDNFSMLNMQEAIQASIEGLEMQAFLNSIVLARGTVKILKPKTSPKDGSELIASHTV